MSYRTYLAEADAYFRVFSNSVTKSKKLGNKVLFSMSTMMIEKYLVSLLMASGKVVTGHNLKSLFAAVKQEFKELPEKLKDLASFDERIDLCGFSPVDSSAPTDEEIDSLYSKLVELKQFVYDSMQPIQKTEYLSL